MIGASIFALTSPVVAQGVAPVKDEATPQATPALLDDSQFDAALPPLDSVQAPGVTATPTPVPVAPVVPTVAATTIVPDAELTAPLVPLAQASVVPPPAAPGAAADAELPPIRYAVTVTGLEQDGLYDRFKPLSALLKDGRKAANAAQITARADEDVALVERILKSEGYYDGVATATVDPAPAAQGTAKVAIVATPGERYKLGTIAVTGAEPSPTALALSALALRTGQPIVATDILTGEAKVALRLPEQGYPFVEVGARDIVLDDRAPVGDYTLPIVSGPRSSFGGFQAAGDDVFGTDHIALLARFKPGQIYDSREVDDLRQALIATSLFSTVAVQPVKTGRTAPDGTEIVDLRVDQSRGPARSLSGSGGYGTGEGIKVTGSWTHRNLFPDEGALITDIVAGTQQQGASATFRRSNAGQRDRTFQASIGAARQDFDAYSARTVNLSVGMSRQSTPLWQKRWTYSVGAEVIGTNESRFDPGDAERTRATYLIGALPMQISYDRSDSLLDPTKGFRLTARVSPEASLQGAVDTYGRFLVEGSTYLPVAGSIVLAARARVGSIIGVSRDDLAPSRRLYAGGGGSVRGFGYQQLGPKDPNNDPIGGRSLTEFAIEGRYRFGNFGVVPFVDAGRVGEASSPSISGLRYGAGIGGRYYTNFGPLRLDVATPIGRKRGESKIALYISIGQAF
ncbi:autotransporter assembly complex protein TamA [Sphingomonas prati]|uniref:Translocation and assembly module TamA n=1 Tax=Sphingomonas prati TaxID=1843237 RepID=A0A7W9BT29_9SPHN|nr:BamA/TamA family outer membrane protein [Sphingomonas prati]MBB5729614.1 translocation and assembly module TamA [Sphingomonas prati]GGE76109.1 outer membrane protein assembly factor [Sphingomonas prati]